MKAVFGTLNKSLTAAALVALMGLPFAATAGDTDTTEINTAHYALSPTDPADLTDGATFSGSYLAARFAQRQQDWTAAQHYMNAAIGFDENNEHMVHRAFLLSLGAGEFGAAKRLADKILLEQQAGLDFALIFTAADALVKKDFDAAKDALAKLPDDGFGQYTKPLMGAWALAGKGDIPAAIAMLRSHADETDPTYNLHAAMMYDVAGDKENAAKHYTAVLDDSLTLHSALLLANFFERYGDTATAQRIYDGLGPLYAPEKLDSHRTPIIRTAADGAAMAIFDLATLLFERRSYDSAQIYSRLVQMLSPSSAFGQLMLGDIATISEKYATAIEAYKSITPSAPLHTLSRLRIAEVYESADLTDNATRMLRELASHPASRLQALIALGDMYRRREDFTQAVAVYDEVLAEVGEPTEAHWAVVYARGMSLERAQNWDRAEKDLLLALSFQPDNPMILNYIGYTWVDKGVNLQKAMDFIRRAVALRPDDGYILDSYGWAYYRLGDMEQAVHWLEKSVALVPDDSTILDHLADAYWQAGRRTEARFKWLRAKELSKDADFRAAVDSKLKNGIEPAATVVVQKDTSL